MSKYIHDFELVKSGPSFRLYKSEENLVCLDFFNHMLRVAIYREDDELFPTYTVCPGEMSMPRHGRPRLCVEGLDSRATEVTTKNNVDSFSIDGVDFSVDLHNFRIKASIDGRTLFEDREYISYNFGHELGKGSTHFLSREEDEHIYGLGDKSGPVNKNKRHYKMETFDAMGYDSRSSDPLYKQLPFYMCRNSVGSYGIYYDTYSTGEFDFGCEKNNYYGIYKSFKCEEDVLVYYVILGEIPEILSRFSYMCGKNLFPPKWTLKYCGSTMSYTDAPNAEEQLRGFVDLCHKCDIDVGGFYLSSGYTQIGERRYVFHWNKDKTKDPKALADYFKSNGIEFLPNIKPAFLSDHPLYEQIAKKGWFLHYEDGTPALFPFWSGFGSYLDFTNDEAFDFWTSCVKENLVDLGYKNTWNDNNEYDIHDETVLADGFGHPIPAVRIRPLFSLLMTMASLEAQDHSKRLMAVTRSGVGGLQRIAETWTGDNNTSFDEFRGNQKIAMTMSLSGFYNFGPDIGGFAGPRPNEELFMRWLQFGVFMPRFVLHSWNPDGSSTMPWLYPDHMDGVKKIFSLRKRLMPYLYNTMWKSVEQYLPIVSPLFLSYEDYDEESDFFLYGKDILVCPIFDEGKNELSIDLPNGVWYRNGVVFEGHVETECGLDEEPIHFYRGGSVIPTDEDGLVFNVYADKDGKLDFEYYEDDGESANNGHVYHVRVEFGDEVVVTSDHPNARINLIDFKRRRLK